MVLGPEAAGLLVGDEDLGGDLLDGFGDTRSSVDEQFGADHDPRVLRVLGEYTLMRREPPRGVGCA